MTCNDRMSLSVRVALCRCWLRSIVIALKFSEQVKIDQVERECTDGLAQVVGVIAVCTVEAWSKCLVPKSAWRQSQGKEELLVNFVLVIDSLSIRHIHVSRVICFGVHSL